MNNSLQLGGNAVLMRELRASLRNARPFALIALYVAILSAIVVSNFPANQDIAIDRLPGGGSPGKSLYWLFVATQAALVLIVLPAMAAGSLSQEREQRTLEPLLLTPLTPLQIVWGKAVGVLSLAGLLMLSTLPLTSLCFLLGGVSPGELVAAYTVLIGLALFTTSIGIYCSARWTNTVRSTLLCYLFLPILLAFLMLFVGIGVIIAALALFIVAMLGVVRVWRQWGEKPMGETVLARRGGVLWTLLLWVVLPLLGMGIIYFLLADRNAGSIAIGIFVILYLIYVSQLGLQQAAREIVRAPEPQAPSRQKWQDMQDDWQQAMSTRSSYLPETAAAAPPQSSLTPHLKPEPQNTPLAPAALSTPSPANAVKETSKETYDEKAFLSEKLNPVFAKDMRGGLLGKSEYLFRFGYIITIGSEVLLIFLAFALPAQSINTEWSWFTGWSKFHLALLMIAGAWLGARAFAPEHEQQTLQQLLMTPLTSAQIAWGKIQAVMALSAYIFALGLPMAILLAAVKVVSWPGAAAFLVIEVVFGGLAAAWGMYCSLKLLTMRRALGVALGGAFCMLVSGFLFDSVVLSGYQIIMGKVPIARAMADVIGALVSPLSLLDLGLKLGANAQGIGYVVSNNDAASLSTLGMVFPLSLALWIFITSILLFLTIRGVRNYDADA